jgi:hypothetical protein
MLALRKFREVIPAERRDLPVSKVGVAGSLLAALGAFCPLLDVAGHHVTYFARGHGDGQIVVGAAFIGLMAATIRMRFITSIAGIVILAMLYGLYRHEVAAVARFGLPHYLADSLTADWGLYLMGGGAVLMVVSSLMHLRPRRHPLPSRT